MLNNILVRLVVYYVSSFLFLAGLFRLFPQILYYIAKERGRHMGSSSLDFEDSVIPMGAGVEGLGRLFDPGITIPVIFSLSLAFVLTLPIAWVYRWTRPKKRYNQSFAHTLLVVPIAIALIVFLVKGSLPLAFSLSGIVAAVQFRTSLNEPMDSIYMFIVIGIGLSAGVQLLSVAFLGSLIFVSIALGVWKFDFGAESVVIDGWTLVGPSENIPLGAAGGLIGTGAQAVASGAKKGNRARLIVRTTNPSTAGKAASDYLDARTKRWEEGDAVRKVGNVSVLTFDVRLKKSVDLDALTQGLEKADGVTSVEATSRNRE